MGLDGMKRRGDFVYTRLVLDKDYEQALKAADSVGNKMEVYRLRREIYVKSGDYEQAYLYASVYNNYKDSLVSWCSLQIWPN